MVGIIDFVLDLYIIFFILRLALEPRQFYFNPLLQPIKKATDFLMLPLGKVFKPTRKGFDYTPLIAILLLVFTRSLIMYALLPSYGSFADSFMDSTIKFVGFIFQVYVVMLIISTFIHRTTYNPIGRFVFQALSPFMGILEKWLAQLRRWIVVPALLILLMAHILIIYALSMVLGLSLSISSITLYSLLKMISVIQFFYLVVIVGALMSWISPDPNNPIVQMVHLIMEPILRPIRKILPTFGGIDLSPIVAIFALVYLQRFLQTIVTQIFKGGGMGF